QKAEKQEKDTRVFIINNQNSVLIYFIPEIICSDTQTFCCYLHIFSLAAYIRHLSDHRCCLLYCIYDCRLLCRD
uniref:Uncharacterized protein n=1 Tax=Amphiprion percula TaxID=161767 RepID=A0A3P8TF60_AMPPE